MSNSQGNPPTDIDSLLRHYVATMGNNRSTATNGILNDCVLRSQPLIRHTSSLTTDSSLQPSLTDTTSTTSSLSDSAVQTSLADTALRGMLQGPSNGLNDAIRRAAIEAVKQHQQQQHQQQQLLQLLPNAASAISRLTSNNNGNSNSFLQAQSPSALTSMLDELQNANALLALQTLANANNGNLPSLLLANDPSSTSSISSGYSSVSSGSSGTQGSVPSLDSNISGQSNQNFLTRAALEILAAQLLNPQNPSDSISDDTGGARKKQKLSDPKDDISHDYQEEKWDIQFKELLTFKSKHGHCRVPQNYEDNPALSHWVKRQRYQHKCKREGKVSSMSESRIRKLEHIGFVWDAQELLWQTRFEELTNYRLKHGHCNVPYNYHLNRKLPTWIKCQRRQFKLLKEGQPSNMTQERITLLQGLGFKWGQRESTVAER